MNNQSFKSPTCRTSKGQPRSTFNSCEAAAQSAQYEAKNRGATLEPYKCDDCGLWHLAPPGRNTPSHTSESCVGRDGRPKEIYDTEEGARKRSRILLKEKGVELYSYHCERCDGWHLTSQQR
jgi:hypothetical protein